jgi:hypothetical protein
MPSGHTICRPERSGTAVRGPDTGGPPCDRLDSLDFETQNGSSALACLELEPTSVSFSPESEDRSTVGRGSWAWRARPAEAQDIRESA